MLSTGGPPTPLRSFGETDFASPARACLDEARLQGGRSLAEREGFEPPVPFRVQWFSRPPPSTTRPSLRLCIAGAPCTPAGGLRSLSLRSGRSIVHSSCLPRRSSVSNSAAKAGTPPGDLHYACAPFRSLKPAIRLCLPRRGVLTSSLKDIRQAHCALGDALLPIYQNDFVALGVGRWELGIVA